MHGTLAEGMQMEHCLRLLAPLFGSHITGLNTNDLAARWASYPVIVGEFDASSLKAIASDYEAKAPVENLWMNRSVHGYRAQGYQYGEAVVTDSELLGSPYYLHFLRPAGIRHGMAICLEDDGSTRFTAISLNRSAAQGAFGEREFRLVRALRPHLVNLYALHRQLAAAQRSERSFRACFERAPAAAAVIDGNGKVLESNPRMEALLERSRALDCNHARLLRFRNPSVQEKFVRAISSLSTVPFPPAPVPFVAGTVESGFRGMLVIHLFALPSAANAPSLDRARMLVMISSLEERESEIESCRTLCTALGLTPSEARTAVLLRTHHDLEQVAIEMRVAISTVRTHMKHVFQKTGTAKQSELVLLVDRLLLGATL
ncbi:hypothetical protein H0E84_09010 [Luteimonas sp. SJ-92]|uniref:HTH luxR-type domain-containing protein n=1 Tax=Luteimonas salinisoli TaxID=2752307 RepID=A0A853JCP7_9GAMM|nr:hypothetical protein [Luteimonas salinisoli]NZA26524.1 hypothetical protein [Luteimonas salinisoli]